MTIIEAITALILLSVFMFGFSQAFMPAYNAWNKAVAEYNTAHTIHFVAESFRKECLSNDPGMERWKRIVRVAKELESYEISELWREEELWALKASRVISGERIEIIGLCAP